jgi:hypothetical protein
MKTGLTKNCRFRTIPRVGQTDAGSAGEQPARDNRPGRRNHVGVEDSSTFLKLNRFWSPVCLKKLPAEGRYYLLCVKGVCPFQAEPIHIFQNKPNLISQFSILNSQFRSLRLRNEPNLKLPICVICAICGSSFPQTNPNRLVFCRKSVTIGALCELAGNPITYFRKMTYGEIEQA